MPAVGWGVPVGGTVGVDLPYPETPVCLVWTRSRWLPGRERTATAEAMIHVAMIRLIAFRLAGKPHRWSNTDEHAAGRRNAQAGRRNAYHSVVGGLRDGLSAGQGSMPWLDVAHSHHTDTIDNLVDANEASGDQRPDQYLDPASGLGGAGRASAAPVGGRRYQPGTGRSRSTGNKGAPAV